MGHEMIIDVHTILQNYSRTVTHISHKLYTYIYIYISYIYICTYTYFCTEMVGLVMFGPTFWWPNFRHHLTAAFDSISPLGRYGEETFFKFISILWLYIVLRILLNRNPMSISLNIKSLFLWLNTIFPMSIL